ncbi:MAG: DegT/DnrJ/EryC1/StrS family aminotransferase [Sphaerochaetaceae bacterium]
MSKKPTDFRYNTGSTAVPWAAVGESYNADDIMDVVKFLLQGEGDTYDSAVAEVRGAVKHLAEVGTAPGKLSLGDKVVQLEQEMDAYLGVEDSTFVSCATSGFEIAFRYANIQKGDEVLVPAITFAATMAYPLAVGAKVVFVDVDPVTLNMDPADMERKITSRTKMVVPVHIGGYPVDMDPVMEIAHRHGILVLEDAAHAFGGTYKGRKLGTIGDFGAFSFHEVKNVTSFGEGGILVSTLPFRSQLKKARFLGLDMSHKIQDWLYDVVALEGKYGPFVANNASATEIQAIGLLSQLHRYAAILAEREHNVIQVNNRLGSCDALQVQPLGDGQTRPTYHLYELQVDPAKAGADVRVLREKLATKGVTTIPHFAPLYRFSIIRQLGYDVQRIMESCPVSEEVFLHRFTHLPIYDLSSGQLDYMADAVLASIDEMKRGV